MFDAPTAPPWPNVLDLPTNTVEPINLCLSLINTGQLRFTSRKMPTFLKASNILHILDFFPSKPVLFWCKVFRPFFDNSSLSSGISQCSKCSKSFVVCDCSCLPSWSVPVWRAQKQQDISPAEPKLLKWKCWRHNGHAIRLWLFHADDGHFVPEKSALIIVFPNLTKHAAEIRNLRQRKK